MTETQNLKPVFSRHLMRFIRFSSLRADDQNGAISWINDVRAKYLWSQRAFDLYAVQDVYLVRVEGHAMAFIECTFTDLDLTSPNPPSLYLHELHVAPWAQNQGVASAVLDHLTRKGLPIEMIVANENEKMRRLMAKLGALESFITTDTRKLTLQPKFEGMRPLKADASGS